MQIELLIYCDILLENTYQFLLMGFYGGKNPFTQVNLNMHLFILKLSCTIIKIKIMIKEFKRKSLTFIL